MNKLLHKHYIILIYIVERRIKNTIEMWLDGSLSSIHFCVICICINMSRLLVLVDNLINGPKPGM